VSTTDTTSIKSKLQKALTNLLPGEEAHREMLPKGHQNRSELDHKPTKQSSVLLLLFQDGDSLNTCFIKRPSTMKNHGGQMAFPGGKYEQKDVNLIQTALRETHEEIGIEATSIAILGALTPVHVQVSNFTIYPFVGWSTKKPVFKVDTSEVDQLIIVPLSNLQDKNTRSYQTVKTVMGYLEAPGYSVEQSFIWGATGMILTEFLAIYSHIIEEKATSSL